MYRLFCVATIVGLSLFVTGCRNEGPGRYGVSGQVTFKSQPLEQGTILFQALNPQEASNGGSAIKGGKYAITAAQGLKAGRYKVMIFSGDSKEKAPEVPGESHRLAKENIPPSFNVNTNLDIEVKAQDQNTFDFQVP